MIGVEPYSNTSGLVLIMMDANRHPIVLEHLLCYNLLPSSQMSHCLS